MGKTYTIQTPQESDEFNENTLGMQWQWMANPKATWYYMNATNGSLRLYSAKIPDSANNLWDVPNVLLQKFPAEEFMVTTKMNFQPNDKLENKKTGLTIMGISYADIALKKKDGKLFLVYGVCENAEKGKSENEKIISEVKNGMIYLRVKVIKGAQCQFSYSFDGKDFINSVCKKTACFFFCLMISRSHLREFFIIESTCRKKSPLYYKNG